MYEQNRIPATLASPEAMARVKALLAAAGAASRTAVGRQVCELLGFQDACGRPQLASCMQALRALDAAGRRERSRNCSTIWTARNDWRTR